MADLKPGFAEHDFWFNGKIHYFRNLQEIVQKYVFHLCFPEANANFAMVFIPVSQGFPRFHPNFPLVSPFSHAFPTVPQASRSAWAPATWRRWVPRTWPRPRRAWRRCGTRPTSWWRLPSRCRRDGGWGCGMWLTTHESQAGCGWPWLWDKWDVGGVVNGMLVGWFVHLEIGWTKPRFVGGTTLSGRDVGKNDRWINVGVYDV